MCVCVCGEINLKIKILIKCQQFILLFILLIYQSERNKKKKLSRMHKLDREMSKRKT